MKSNWKKRTASLAVSAAMIVSTSTPMLAGILESGIVVHAGVEYDYVLD